MSLCTKTVTVEIITPFRISTVEEFNKNIILNSKKRTKEKFDIKYSDIVTINSNDISFQSIFDLYTDKMSFCLKNVMFLIERLINNIYNNIVLDITKCSLKIPINNEKVSKILENVFKNLYTIYLHIYKYIDIISKNVINCVILELKYDITKVTYIFKNTIWNIITNYILTCLKKEKERMWVKFIIENLKQEYSLSKLHAQSIENIVVTIIRNHLETFVYKKGKNIINSELKQLVKEKVIDVIIGNNIREHNCQSIELQSFLKYIFDKCIISKGILIDSLENNMKYIIDTISFDNKDLNIKDIDPFIKHLINVMFSSVTSNALVAKYYIISEINKEFETGSIKIMESKREILKNIDTILL